MEKEFTITGMSCGGCVRHVTNAINTIPGVLSVNVDLDSKKANVTAESSVSDESIIQVIQDSGYGIAE